VRTSCQPRHRRDSPGLCVFLKCRFYFGTVDADKWSQFVEQFLEAHEVPGIFVVDVEVPPLVTSRHPIAAWYPGYFVSLGEQAERYYMDRQVTSSAALVKFVQAVSNGEVRSHRQRSSAYQRIMEQVDIIMLGEANAITVLKILEEPAFIICAVFVVLVIIAVWTSNPPSPPKNKAD
jgi:hypothetical protein